MSKLTLVNDVPASNTPRAEFRILQGSNQIARIDIASGGSATLPLSNSYSVQAVTTMGGFTLTSNTLTFTDDSAQVVAEVLEENGTYDFQLAQAPGADLSTITLENTWRSPVQFTITQPGTPVEIINVVDESNNAVVSTAQQWQCYAIVNGITTGTVMTNNPNAVFTVTTDNNDAAYRVTVS